MTGPEHSRTLKGLSLLLDIKDSDIRILTLEQCREAVDKGIHSGGAFSATIPLVALYYGGMMNYNIRQPTATGQDMFVLSKGHAVATLASIYADLGYFSGEVLLNSRSSASILNGHPGPILPGIHISTGPLGQGIGVAQGFAIRGREDPDYNVFCMTGDGELQEGIAWEAIMYSAHKRLGNFCVLVDKNHGQLDLHDRLVFPMENLAGKFESFGWNVMEIDARSYLPVLEALKRFGEQERDGKPTAIICDTTKGYGAFNPFLNRHKVVIPDSMMEEELSKQQKLRGERVKAFLAFTDQCKGEPGGRETAEELQQHAEKIRVRPSADAPAGLGSLTGSPVLERAPVREKRILYRPEKLPRLERDKSYAASEINSLVLEEFARDHKVVSVDADLASTSGLEAGISRVDPARALNVGVAEANMMNLGEAFAVLGGNVFVSTFCPFFDWKVLRRIAVGYQERMEDIASGKGWLNEGHGLDLCFVATAPNFETQTNGATHMGNDDTAFFSAMAHLKIIDVGCPQLQIAVLKWIAAGNSGLVYMRVMRAAAGVLYSPETIFEYGRGYILKDSGGYRMLDHFQRQGDPRGACCCPDP